MAVIDALALGMLHMMEASKTRSGSRLIAQFGAQLAATMERTSHELCSLFSSFVAERRSNPLLGAAVVDGYARLAQHLSKRLVAQGHAPRSAQDTAQVVVMLLEGGATLAQAQQSTLPFKLAIRQAEKLCAKPVVRVTDKRQAG